MYHLRCPGSSIPSPLKSPVAEHSMHRDRCRAVDERRRSPRGSTCSRLPVFCIGYRVDAADMTRPVVHLTYTLWNGHSAPRHFDYPVLLETTQTHLGGLRCWFTCPRCGRRAQELYNPPGASRFGCRNCYRLSYRCRSYGPLGRARERARKIQLRLGGSVSLADPFPLKPKGMWWKTLSVFEMSTYAIVWQRSFSWSDGLKNTKRDEPKLRKKESTSMAVQFFRGHCRLSGESA
jgi:hypothetical protein